MKIIFLDHDGPMVLRQKTKIPEVVTEFAQVFDKDAVYALNEILLKTDAEIVVSSDWRLYFSLNQLKDIYRDVGIIKTPISVTPNYWKKYKNRDPKSPFYSKDPSIEEIRSQEIRSWVEKYNTKINHWVAIDDLNLNLDNFVRTDPGFLGISDESVKDKVLEYLKTLKGSGYSSVGGNHGEIQC